VASSSLAVCFEFSDGALTRERLFSADAAEPESAEPLVVAAEPVQWSGNADELTAWFARSLAEAHLPTEAFHLEPGRLITDPAKWYAALCRDIGAGARGPRAGALVDELRSLREIVEGKWQTRR
jgi:hypothetical protein